MDNKRLYTVTDGMGFMSEEEMSSGYGIARRLSSKLYHAKDYSLKKICEHNYTCKFGRAPSEVTDKMKTYTRFTLKNPEHVFVICPEVNSTIESKINMWVSDFERDIKVTVIETASTTPRVSSYTPTKKVFAPVYIKAPTVHKTDEEKDDTRCIKYFVKIRTASGRVSQRLKRTVTYDSQYIEELSNARRCAIIWGQALGWSFSAPLERSIQFIDADFHTYRNRLSVFGAGKRTQDKIDDPDFKIPTVEELNYDWWKCKMSGKGAPDAIDSAIQCIRTRTPEKEPEYDSYFITRDELEANHAKLSPTRHTVGAFQTEFVTRAPESECEEFFKYYKKLRANAGKSQMWDADRKEYIFYKTEARDENGRLTFYSTDGYHFDSCLEPDWAICPECGKPYKTVDSGESGGICGYCKAKLDIMAISRTEQFAVNNLPVGYYPDDRDED